MFSVGCFGPQQSKIVQEMELAASLGLGILGLSLAAFQRKAVKKLQDDDTKHKTLLRLILSSINEVELLLKNQKMEKLKTSLQEFRVGLNYLEKFSRGYNRDQEEKVPRAEFKIDDTFVDASLLAENMTLLTKLANLDEAADAGSLEEARKNFEKACDNAKTFLNSGNLPMAEQILAANIVISAAILTKIKDPSMALQECKVWIENLNKKENVKELFGRILKSGKKLPIKGSDQTNCFLGVCYANRSVYEISRIAEVASKLDPKDWIWPFIEVEKKKFDPLRDIRVFETLFNNTNMKNCCFPWSFGRDLKEKKKQLKIAQDIAINREGHFIVIDKGDQMVKIFDEKGTFLHSFQPLSRRLADEDVCGVSIDQEDNLFVLIKIDKYHHEVRVFDQYGNLKSRFRLREGSVRCSLVTNDNKEILVINENPGSDRCVVELYSCKDGQYVRSIELDDSAEPSEPKESNGLKSPREEDPKAHEEAGSAKGAPKDSKKSKESEDKDPKERTKPKELKALSKPKDIAITDSGSVMVLYNDGRVDECKFDGQKQRHQMYEKIQAKGIETIAFHSPSEHVLIANRSDGIAKVSVFTECGGDSELATSFHVYEDNDPQEKKEYITPRIAMTKEGRIAVLTGFVGESKVTVF